MKKNFWDKRIPTLLALLVIVLAIGVTSYLVGQNTFFQGNASPSSSPQDIRVTNISDTTATVSYISSDSVIGSLNFGGSASMGQNVLDERDNGGVKVHKIHTFSIKNLSPSTKYFFSIVSGQDSYLNNGTPYEFSTGPSITAAGNVGFIVGKVLTADGNIPSEAEVFATSDGVSPLSTTVKNDGTYTISMENLRKEDLSAFANLKSSSLIRLLIVSDSGSSSIQIQAKGINNVPVTILSKDYDFEDILSASPSSTPSSSKNFPKIAMGSSGNTPMILTPGDSQNFKTQRPLFAGTGIPNDQLKILIQSDQTIQSSVTVDSSGNWSFQPTTVLAPGQHTITITGKDALGVLRVISKTFTVTVAEAAMAPTPTPTPTPSAAPSTSPSASPTPSVIPSSTPIVVASPTPAIVATPTPISSVQLPATGENDIPTGILGISAAVAGSIFLLISKLLL